jgi:hypothetical protein
MSWLDVHWFWCEDVARKRVRKGERRVFYQQLWWCNVASGISGVDMNDVAVQSRSSGKQPPRHEKQQR